MILPGTKVTRLTNSTTGRDIKPGDIGSVGGITPTDHANPVSFDNFDTIPIQWLRSGLWSSLPGYEEGHSWKLYVPPVVPTTPKKPKITPKKAPKSRVLPTNPKITPNKPATSDNFGLEPFKL